MTAVNKPLAYAVPASASVQVGPARRAAISFLATA